MSTEKNNSVLLKTSGIIIPTIGRSIEVVLGENATAAVVGSGNTNEIKIGVLCPADSSRIPLPVFSKPLSGFTNLFSFFDLLRQNHATSVGELNPVILPETPLNLILLDYTNPLFTRDKYETSGPFIDLNAITDLMMAMAQKVSEASRTYMAPAMNRTIYVNQLQEYVSSFYQYRDSRSRYCWNNVVSSAAACSEFLKSDWGGYGMVFEGLDDLREQVMAECANIADMDSRLVWYRILDES